VATGLEMQTLELWPDTDDTDKCTCLQQSLLAADPVSDIFGELLMTVVIVYGCIANNIHYAVFTQITFIVAVCATGLNF